MNKLLSKYKVIPVQVRASMWFLLCAFLQKGISFITTPIFTRIMSTAEYGQYGVFNSWMSILTNIITLNLFSGVFSRGLVKFEKERPIFISSLQGLTLSLCVLWTLIYIIFNRLFNSLTTLSTNQTLLMILIIWTTSVFNFWAMSQRVDFKYRNLVMITLIVSLANPVLGIIFIKFAEDKVTARILAIVCVEIVAYSGLFIQQMVKGKKFFSAKFWKHALSFNIPLIPHYLSTTILNSSDRIMIGKIVDSSSAGIYTLAYSISMIMTMFNTALLQTLEPWLYKRIKKREINDISKVAYPSFALIIIVNLLLIAVAPEVITIFAPSEYYDAIWVIPPVAMSVFFMFSYTFFAVFEFYFEKTKLIAIATCTGAVLNVLLNLIFIKLFGYYAAGYTTLLCFIIYSLFHYVMMCEICKTYLNGVVPYSSKIFICMSLCFLGLGFLFLFTYELRMVRYALIILMMIGIVIMRKKIMTFINQIISIKHKKS